MAKLSVLSWIGNAAAVLFGSHGTVAQQVQQAGCSRQTAYDHADKVQHAVADAQLPGPSRAQLLEDNQRLRQQLQQLQEQQQCERRIDLGKDKQKQLATTTWAMGLSLNQIEDVLALLLPAAEAPDRSSIGRWVLDAAHRAGRLLSVLDDACTPLTEVLCLDEIFFHGRPVLVGVEPASMAFLLCRRSADRQGETWKEALLPFTQLQAVVRDAGSGLSAGVQRLDEHRQARHGGRPLEDGLDVFHTEQEAQRLLTQLWRGVERHWHAAEEADRKVLEAKQRQRDARGPAARARAAWRRAVASLECYQRREAIWRRAKAALALFRPDGQLNSRVGAAAELAAACAQLRGPAWSKVRAFLQDARTLTFLDRTERLLAEAEPRPELREALLALWRLQQQERSADDERSAARATAQVVVQRVICQHRASDWVESYRRVGRVLSGVVRASSVVECVNSVLRMQQARHRTMTQPMLDLKRLYWNTRALRSGKRKDRCPYEHLGLALPSYDFWELLHQDPTQLAQQLSIPALAA